MVEITERFIVFYRRPGDAEPTACYRGDDLKAAQSAVTSMIGKCQQVWTVRNGIRLTTYDSDKFGLGLCWDAHESWLKDLHAGHFDEAFLRDHLNDELAKGRITSREWDVQYADFLARREKHV